MMYEQGPDDHVRKPPADRFDRMASGFAIAAVALLVAAIIVYLRNV
jgi:hypothetical protein